MDGELAPKVGKHDNSALPESIPDSLRECLQWPDQELPSPLRKPPSRQPLSIALVPDKFDTGSRGSSSQVQRQKSLVPRQLTAPEERGSAPLPRTQPWPVAWRRKRRRLPGAPDPRIAGAALDSAGPAVRRAPHLPGRLDFAPVASIGGR